MINKKILCYSPYNSWELHGLWEITILHALKLRGAEIKHILCDGCFSACDLHWEATSPRDENSCTNCKASTALLSAKLNFKYEYLSKYIDSDELEYINKYIIELNHSYSHKAKFNNWNIGEWVKSSVHSHFRINTIDLSIEKVRNIYCDYIESGLKAAYGIQRIIKSFKPDILFIFNGRQSSLRIAYEIAKENNIDVYMHERGTIKECVRLYKNIGTNRELDLYYKSRWNYYKDIKLTNKQENKILHHLNNIKGGNGLNWKSFNTDKLVGKKEIISRLGIKNKKIWLLFTSSSDEIISANYKNIFENQIDWIISTIKIALKNNITLIIRIHPNSGGKNSTGINTEEIQKLEDVERKFSCKDIIFIRPDDAINSYDLFNISEVGITYGSTIGLEMACDGKKVVVCIESLYSELNFVWTLRKKENYESLLTHATRIKVDKYTKEYALRFAYYYYFIASNIEFPLIKMPDPHTGTLNYNSLDELLPTKDMNLDKICDIILNNKEIISKPEIHTENILVKKIQQQLRENYCRTKKTKVADLTNKLKDGLSQIIDNEEIINRFVYIYEQFEINKIYNREGYLLMRELTIVTKGKLKELFINIVGEIFPPKSINIGNSIFNNLSIDKINKEVNKNGYHVLDKKLPIAYIEEIYNLSKKIKCVGITNGESIIFPKGEITDYLYQYKEEEILKFNCIQEILSDNSFYDLARKNLKSEPILKSVDLWWSTSKNRGNEENESAQYFHIDMDNIAFFHIFVYITDVTMDSGPHSYVEGSNKFKPAELWRDGRMTIDDVLNWYNKEDIKFIIGQSGTIIAGDTHSLHRGVPPIKNNRLILQFIFTTSLFGAEFKSHYNHSSHYSPEFQKFINNNPRIFERFSK